MIHTDYLKRKKWTDFLLSLEVGTYVVQLKSVQEMNSCKAVGYRLNGAKKPEDRYFGFALNYEENVITILVSKRL